MITHSGLNEVEKRIKKTSEDVNAFFEIFRSKPIKDSYSKVFSEIRYVVLEIHVVLEFCIDRVILKRYCDACSKDAQQCIALDVLSQIDFARKIYILENIKKCHDCIDIGKLKFFNNLRNGLVHNFPAYHPCFKYRNGQIIYDGTIKYLLSDILKALKNLSDVKTKIAPIESGTYLSLRKHLMRDAE